MNTIIILFIAIANIIAILLLYFSFGRNMDKQKKTTPIMITVGSVYIITLLTYLLSSIGIEKTSAAQTARDMIIMAFVPVNTILFLPFLIRSYMKVKSKALTIENFKKRTIIIAVLAIIVLIGEFSYFRNYQKNLKKLENTISNNSKQETSNREINNIENFITNDAIDNTLSNETNNTEY